MKKILAVILAGMFTLAALVSCTAPAQEDIVADNTNETTVDPQIEGEEAVLPEAEEDITEDGTQEGTAMTESFASVAEFLEAYPTIGDTLKEAFGGEMDIELEARGNKLVYLFSTDIFDEFAQQNPEAINEISTEVFGNLAPTLGQALLSMQKSIPSLEALIIELRDSQGKVVYNDEITPDDVEVEEGADINYEEFAEGMTVADYAAVLSQTEVYSDETFVVTIEARGNNLAYIYTLKEQLDVTNEFITSLDESYSYAEETLSPVYVALKAAMPDLEYVIYEYVNADGSVIAAYEYAE